MRVPRSRDDGRVPGPGGTGVLGLAKRLRVPVFQASTREAHGDPEVDPQVEDYWGRVNPIGPRACCDEGKRCAETLFFDSRRQHGLRIRVARIFNAYGPRMHPHDGRVVSDFIVRALRGEPLTIHGDGRQTRSLALQRPDAYRTTGCPVGAGAARRRERRQAFPPGRCVVGMSRDAGARWPWRRGRLCRQRPPAVVAAPRRRLVARLPGAALGSGR